MNKSRAVGASGGEDHLRCDLRKRAKAFAPMWRAFGMALFTPPAAETWAPMYICLIEETAVLDAGGIVSSFAFVLRFLAGAGAGADCFSFSSSALRFGAGVFAKASFSLLAFVISSLTTASSLILPTVWLTVLLLISFPSSL